MTSTRPAKPPLSATISWILYDFANTAYSMNVVSLYFSTWIILDLAQRDIWVSAANSLSMLLVAISMPVLGDWSDHKGKKVSLLLLFTAVCILGTAGMGAGGFTINNVAILVPLMLFFYTISNYAYQGGLVFYNALMPHVSTPRTIGRISGYGVALGYLGSVTGLMIARAFVEGDFFGMNISFIQGQGTAGAFFPTAIIFLIFSIPLFVFVKEPKVQVDQENDWSVSTSYKKVWTILKDTQKYPGLLRFLIAKLFYEDSVQTIILFMGVYTQAVMGFSRAEANQFFIVVIPSAIIGSALCGILTDHYGPKKTLLGVIFLWVISLICVILITNQFAFWIIGCVIGALLGSVWTAARPLLISLVPSHMLGEFFGLYALSGKVAAILGPLIWSLTTFLFNDFGDAIKYKAAIGALLIIMSIGFFILIPVPDFHKKQKSGRL